MRLASCFSSSFMSDFNSDISSFRLDSCSSSSAISSLHSSMSCKAPLHSSSRMLVRSMSFFVSAMASLAMSAISCSQSFPARLEKNSIFSPFVAMVRSGAPLVSFLVKNDVLMNRSMVPNVFSRYSLYVSRWPSVSMHGLHLTPSSDS